MNIELPLSCRVRRGVAGAGAAACFALGALGAGCQSQPESCPDEPSVSSKLVTSRLTVGGSSRIDLVLAIDNSRSMADKQQILALAVPDLVKGLVNPPCIDPKTDQIVSTPPGPLDDCPPGTKRKVDPALDVHVGIVSSSLGGHGSDACSTGGGGKASNNDKGHLLDRKDPSSAETIETYQNLHFLAWDPAQMLNPPGEADIDMDSSADGNDTALVPSLRDMVLGVGQIGCGYESQLESWYRFLVDPSPADSVSIDADQNVVLNGVDTVLLDQRKAFLRPDSNLAIVMLTDENDCSLRESGQLYLAAQQKTTNGSPFHLPKARAVCDQDPNNECCFSCAQTGPVDGSGNPTCDDDPTCKTPDGKTVYLDELTDNINLRCWNQKRRFGIDFLNPTDRYVKALSDATVTDRNGQVVPNPIFSDLDPSDAVAGIRGEVLFAAIVGVPWQDIARTNANGVPDLKAGIDSSGVPRGGFRNASEMAMPLPGTDYSTWDVILGVLDGYPAKEELPKDPLMIESVDVRAGTNPITGDQIAPPSQPLGNKINGNDWTIGLHNDLQYACIFPLVEVDPATGAVTPAVRDCSVPGVYAGCDCEDKNNDNPLCQAAASGNPTDQVRAKAYPGLRELKVVKDLGDRGVVASVCPAQLDKPADTDFGYRPAIAAVLDRLVSNVDGSCASTQLSVDDQGRVDCVILEAKTVDGAQAGACNACSADGRSPVSSDHAAVKDGILQDNPAANFNCFCEIDQLSGKQMGQPLWACQNDTSPSPVDASGSAVDGYCYVDIGQGLGDPDVVNRCPDSEKRLVRFVGKGNPMPGSTVFLTCLVEQENPPNPACEDAK